MLKYLPILIFLAVVGFLMYFLLGFTRNEYADDVYRLEAFFEATGGIRRNAPVTLSGVQVGIVEKLELSQERRGIVATLAIDSAISIPNDSRLRIAEKGMLGELYLEFEYGSSRTAYKPGEELQGLPPVSLNEFMGSAGDMMESLGKEFFRLSKNMNAILEKRETKEGVQQFLAELPLLVDDVRKTIAQNGNTLGMTVVEVSELSKSLKNMVDQINQDLGGDREDQENKTRKLTELLDSGSEMLAEAQLFLREARQSVSHLNSQSGTAGKLLKDEALYNNMNSAILSAIELIDMISDNPSSLIFGKKKSFEVDEDSRRAKSNRNPVIENLVIPDKKTGVSN